MWWIRVALAEPDWVPDGMYAAPWTPATIGSAEVYRLSAAGVEWLAVRDEGQLFEGRAAYAHLAAAGADAAVLGRAACALVAPKSLSTTPWTQADRSIPDALEAPARPPALAGGELAYWYPADGDLVGVRVGPDGSEVSRTSARQLEAERKARFEQLVRNAQSARSPERVAATVRAVAAADDPGVDAALAELAAEHAAPAGRVAALEVVARRRRPGALATLVAGSRDPSPDVRRAAVQLLADFGPDGLPAVLAATSDPDPGVASLARVLAPRP
ncbi:MAG: HEAT repeat domain-containing protein [Myxococcota bacterium]